MGSDSPSVLRAACRAKFFRHIDTLGSIADDLAASPAARIKAIEALGRFGLGAADHAAVHLHAEAGAVLGVVYLPPIERPALPAAELKNDVTPHVEVTADGAVAALRNRGIKDTGDKSAGA